MVNLRSTDNISPRVRQALWDRTLEENGPRSLDRYSLEAVAKVWPDKLLEEETIEKASQWSSSARLAYVNALRAILKEHGRGSTVARVASQFLVDDESNIRRHAAWITRDSEPAVLQQAVDRFEIRAEELDQAVFMLDAAFWLEADWERYEALGRSHREPLVREIARDLSEERKHAMLAREYVPIVLGSNDLLNTWCYGQALLELGNEETIAALYAALPEEVYRRSYLIWLAKKLEKSLEKKRKDQSEKRMLPPPPTQEEPVEVTLELDGERVGPFTGVLQRNTVRRARRLSAWSIRIDNEPDLALRLRNRDTDEAIYVETPDGGRARALLVQRPYDDSEDLPLTEVLLLGQSDLR
jgi:hypothetical protein